jgi:hypothetical protein
MTVTSKREYLGKVRERYRRAGRGYKARILDEFCVGCGYERKWAIRLLNRRLRGPARHPGPTPRNDNQGALRGFLPASFQIGYPFRAWYTAQRMGNGQ